MTKLLDMLLTKEPVLLLTVVKLIISLVKQWTNSHMT